MCMACARARPRAREQGRPRSVRRRRPSVVAAVPVAPYPDTARTMAAATPLPTQCRLGSLLRHLHHSPPTINTGAAAGTPPPPPEIQTDHYFTCELKSAAIAPLPGQCTGSSAREQARPVHGHECTRAGQASARARVHAQRALTPPVIPVERQLGVRQRSPDAAAPRARLRAAITQPSSATTDAELTEAAEGLAAAHPTLCGLSSIGQSREGRELWLVSPQRGFGGIWVPISPCRPGHAHRRAHPLDHPSRSRTAACHLSTSM